MTQYDVIVVGARCAGSPTAMLLARKGYRVLVVDRSRFPSDMLSTHIVHPLATAALARWGLLERVVATGCPPIHRYSFDFGPVTVTGAPGTDDLPPAYCPRRTRLDAVLVQGAAEAGAEIREGFSVDELVVHDGRVAGVRGRAGGGDTVTELATVVVGADGRHSFVARSVHAERYNERPAIQGGYYTYFADLPVGDSVEFHSLDNCGFAAAPTNDGLTMVVAGWPIAIYEENRRDYERSFMSTLEMIPSFGERVREARRVERLFGASTPNFFRTPFGPGWALVGDAGYEKDPITAQGIMDAFLDAERCAGAIDRYLSGSQPFDDSMREYQRARDERALPMYDLTCDIAALQPPTPEMEGLLRSIAGNQPAMDRFAQMNAGTITPAEFFAPFSGATAPPPSGAMAG